jgi:SAM-dependent methyltransferase
MIRIFPRKLHYAAAAILEPIQILLGTRDPLLPSRELIDSVGGGDYKALGNQWFRHFTTIGGLKPDHRVLDVGCGCGRIAVPLLEYISGNGGYWGFDITRAGIRWCERRIASRRPNFHFTLADIYNKNYHPEGRIQPVEYRFPYADGFFDFIFLTSVFTHMQAPEMNRYLSEIARVMKSGARCMMSFFLMNPEVRNLPQDKAIIDFKFKLKDCYSSREDIPEAAIAFDEGYVRDRFSARGLRIIEPIHFGCWCGRKQFVDYQDIVLATKP